MHTLRRARLVLITLTLAACSGGIKLYKSDQSHNLKVTTTAQKVAVSLDIYTINAQCQTDYQGTVQLKDEVRELGLIIGKPHYLVAAFASSSFLGASNSSTSYEMVVTPRPGYRYEMALRYIDGIYNVELFEIARSSGKRRELETQQPPQCSP